MAEEKQEKKQEKEEKQEKGPIVEETSFFKKIIGLVIKVLIVILFILVLIFVARGVISGRKEKETTEEGIKEYKEVVVKKQPLITKKLKQMRFNLSDPKGKTAIFFVIEVNLGYKTEDPLFTNEITKREPEMTDIIRGIITKKTFNNLEGPENIKILKEEIKSMINNVLKYGQIEDIFFSEYNIIPRE